MAKLVLVTGADGFVGRILCPALEQAGFSLRRALWRHSPTAFAYNQEGHPAHSSDTVLIGSLGPATDWAEALPGVDVVIHLAARVHVMKESSPDPLSQYREVNVEGTARLALCAAKAGVRRFLYLSSIGVNGDSSPGRPFSEADPPQPHDAYSLSKWEAEQALTRISRETELDVVIVRPPLVYGPGVPGNLLRLLRLVATGIPLPLASIQNKRSFVGIRNLCSFLLRCIEHPEAGGETFLIADGEDLSTPELIRYLAKGLGIPDRLFPFPPRLLLRAGQILGRGAEIERLIGSLQVDSSKARRMLGWEPIVSTSEGLTEMASWYRASGEFRRRLRP